MSSDFHAEFGAAICASLIAEEHKGDLRRAREIADAALADAQRRGDCTAAADALVAAAHASQLGGGTGAALALLERARTAASGAAPMELYWIAALHALVTSEHWEATLDRRLIETTEASMRSANDGSLGQEALEWRALSAAVDARQAQMGNLIHTVVPRQLSTRYVALYSRLQLNSPQESEQGLAESLHDLDEMHRVLPRVGWLQLAAAQIHWWHGNRSQAALRVDAARAAYATAGDVAGEGSCAMTTGDWASAPASSPLALNFFLMDFEGGSGSTLPWQIETNEARYDGFDAAAAQAHYAEAEAAFAAARAPRGLAALKLRRAHLAATSGDAAGAASLAEVAAQAFAACGDGAGEHLAAVHAALHRIALPTRPESKAACAEVGRWGANEGSFSFAHSVGTLCSRAARDWLTRRGDAERALSAYRMAEALFEPLGAQMSRARSLVGQASCADATGDLPTTTTLYEQALEIMATDGSARPAMRKTLRRQSMMLGVKVVHARIAQGDAAGIERSGARLSTLLKDRQEPPIDARPCLDDEFDDQIAKWALDAAEQSEVFASLCRGREASDAGDAARAELFLDQAYAAAKRADDNQRHFLLALVYEQRGDLDRAVAAFEQFLAASDRRLPAFQRFGAPDVEAQRLLDGQMRFDFTVRNKHWVRARTALNALEAIAGRNWWQIKEKPWEELLSRAKLEEAEGDLPAALATCDAAIALLEAQRANLRRDDLKRAIGGDNFVQLLYFVAARCALRYGDAGLAFRRAESGRARALLDLLEATSARPVSDACTDEVSRWHERQSSLALTRGLLTQARSATTPEAERIAALERRISEGEDDLVHLEAELARSHPRFAQAIDRKAEPISLDAAAAALAPGMALLQFAFRGDGVIGWVVTKDGIAERHFAALDTRAFGRWLVAFHGACRERRDAGPLGAMIASVLLEPFAETLRTHLRVVVVPYGAAHRVPIAALPFDGVPLGVSHVISVLPSASLLRYLTLDQPLVRHPAPRVLAIGNPGGDLRGAQVEAAEVATLYGDDPLVRDKATLDEVLRRLPGRRVLHFATHAVLDEKAPLASAIQLAGGDLDVHRLMGLRLDVDVVVLSACETGLGGSGGGEDIVGLTRGLLAAGARAAVVSLWPVDDASAAQLMCDFHQRLRSGATPARALHDASNALRTLSNAERDRRSAALALPSVTRERRIGGLPHVAPRDDWSQPYHWAPFVLVG